MYSIQFHGTIKWPVIIDDLEKQTFRIVYVYIFEIINLFCDPGFIYFYLFYYCFMS
jgi:hypothetical protein